MSMLKRFAKVLCTPLLCMAMVNNAMAAVVTYYHNDISGSPIAATDAAGNLKWKESYKPYGDKLTRSAASSDNKIGFHGKAHDDSTGLSYMGARYYDPLLGRFTGVDPVDFKADNLHSFNRYTYTNNNPYKFTDKNGKYAELVIEGASIALGTYSFQKNIDSGNYGAAAADAAGIAFDAVMSVIPFVPGVASLGLDAARGGKNIEKLLPSKTPDFVVAPDGTTFKVPKGAEGPVPVVNPSGNTTGTAFVNGAGGDNGKVSTMRLMQPTPARGSSPGYPNGYIKYENKSGQGVDPNTGKTLPNSQSHFPIR
ncbi:RHS domain-containing protein [Pseudomonas sp. DCB_AW]|uniref:RHS repeat domain-containing protein n=1 Tax=Pseudomonas sp. DCB_AW TaxID=2993596 RepID=UPI00224953DC|nr:RHS repeat-associated core domain-containing protein [Pseudomonas sp. DCB_AW]MCX2684301.1 RHS domain-containing protein [Pseudomonas sp. DCB_AW]